MKKKEKIEWVKKLTEIMKESKINIFASFLGLSVKEMQDLREMVKEKEGQMIVIKNKLTERVFKNLKKDELCSLLDGPMFVVWTKGKDQIGVIKSLFEFMKKNGKIKVKGALSQDEFLTVEKLEQLSKLPGLKELQSSVVNYIRLPVIKIVNDLKFIIGNIVNIINKIKEKKERENGG